MILRPLALLSALAPAWAAVAAPPELGLPVDCRPGQDCWLIHTYDHDPGPGARDTFCGPMTYDGHDGVDIGLADLEAMRRGVQVLAAAPGRVRAVRDGMEDVPVERIGGASAVDGRECGNGVFVDHADGWSTQYCHLRQGSIAVAAGDRVERGSVLGLVGNSGEASFPHLHLTLREGETQLDPFLPKADPGSCSTRPVQGYWTADAAQAMAYAPVALVSLGISDGPVEMDAMLDGTADDRPLTSNSPALVAALMGYYFRKGDRIRLKLYDPAGKVAFEQEGVQAKDQARTLLYGGRKRPASGWEPGTWRASAELSRDGQSWRIERDVPVGP